MVPVTTKWRLLRWLMEETVSRCLKVAANVLIKQWRAADKGWSSSLGVGLGTTALQL